MRMAVDGTWKLTVNSPMGAQEGMLELTTSGNRLTGTQSAATGESQPIQDGTIDGNAIRWKASITRPVPLSLEFSGTVSGDTLQGSVKLGMFGSASFTGVRA
jgi:hypothetical protein